jgi:hypothetical protein
MAECHAVTLSNTRKVGNDHESLHGRGENLRDVMGQAGIAPKDKMNRNVHGFVHGWTQARDRLAILIASHPASIGRADGLQ